jgi:NADH dehydrogenase FAD-containing subunit
MDYAHGWLQSRGVDIMLGKKLISWDASRCIFEDESVLHADLILNCFGGRANSQFLATGSLSKDMDFYLTKSKNIVVNAALQVQGGPIDDGSIFACGDVASPPTGYEKQAFQAECQAEVAAHNILALLLSSERAKLRRYPQDLTMNKSDQMPLVADLSLGPIDGVVVFQDLCIPGPLSAVAKWILEFTKVMQMQGRPLGILIWKIADFVVLFLSAHLLKSKGDPKKL